MSFVLDLDSAVCKRLELLLSRLFPVLTFAVEFCILLANLFV